MAHPLLYLEAQLGHGPPMAPWDKQRIVPKAGATSGPKRNRSGTASLKGPQELAPRRQGHPRDEAGLSARRPESGHRPQELGVVRLVILSGPCESSRSDSRSTAQGLYLKPRILAQNRKDCVARSDDGLLDRILPEGSAILGDGWDFRKLIQGEGTKGGVPQESAQLLRLFSISGG